MAAKAKNDDEAPVLSEVEARSRDITCATFSLSDSPEASPPSL